MPSMEMETQVEIIFTFYENDRPHCWPVSQPPRVIVHVKGVMLTITETINFMTGQARAVVAIEETSSAVIAHLIDIDGQLRCHCIGALVCRRDGKVMRRLPLELIARNRSAAALPIPVGRKNLGFYMAPKGQCDKATTDNRASVSLVR